MTVDDSPGTVTISKGQGLFLRADDAGVLVRNFHFGPARRIAWAEISHFADGRYTKKDLTSWMLVIMLRTGKQVRVLCSVLEPTGKVVAAVREAAQPHGILADLAGSPMKDGRPQRDLFYADPGGQAGVRYWDGRQWSPLLPPAASKLGPVENSPDSWLALPVAERRWRYAATRARRWTAALAVAAVVSAGLLTAGLVTVLWWDRGTYHRHASAAGWFGFGVIAAVFALRAWGERRFFRKLDQAASASGDGG
jgi:Protein of unknown function (DUF2510)